MYCFGFKIMWIFVSMIQGLDLSPYFLAVAAHKEEKLSRQNPIRWVHANGEATGLPSNSFDLVSLAYVVNFYQNLISFAQNKRKFQPIQLSIFFAVPRVSSTSNHRTRERSISAAPARRDHRPDRQFSMKFSFCFTSIIDNKFEIASNLTASVLLIYDSQNPKYFR